jgi:hypothetical protein
MTRCSLVAGYKCWMGRAVSSCWYDELGSKFHGIVSNIYQTALVPAYLRVSLLCFRVSTAQIFIQLQRFLHDR